MVHAGTTASRLTMAVPVAFLLLTTGCSSIESPPEPAGVSWELASSRSQRISGLSYSLTFRVPEDPGEALTGSLNLQFELKEPELGLVLDFQAPPEFLRGLRIGNQAVPIRFENGRIEVPAENLVKGRNLLDLAFQPSDTALNRQPGYLYSLFVPDRASTAFPCFDQPDLKANYRLVLNVPQSWTPLANGAVSGVVEIAGRKIVSFRETELLSTYQFAFAAGEFSTVERTEGDRVLRLFHRESDSARLERNLDPIFEWHFRSLQAMEDYTGIALPYQKFEFLLVPGFQFGGMEHPGAVYYRDSTLLLEASASLQDELDRAHLIVHETAHMWFGNLVTMRWFDDVWMKEVFANFMAARIAHPAFPGLNHAMAFFLGHHPAAGDIDRSAGTHPIRQQLDNLREAADLYGPIIYQKAPIVLRQLEQILGEDLFRQGVTRYLNDFSHGNADWTDLIRVLDGLTDADLAAWSRMWVETAGRPEIRIAPVSSPPGLEIEAIDPQGLGRVWTQRFRLGFFTPSGIQAHDLVLDGTRHQVAVPSGSPPLVVGNADGAAYGRIVLESSLLDQLASRLSQVQDPVARASACLTLLEAVLAGELPPESALQALARQIEVEPEPRLLQYQLDLTASIFWRLLEPSRRAGEVNRLETAMLGRIQSGEVPGVQLSALRALAAVALTPSVLEQLGLWWEVQAMPTGIELGETDTSRIAQELALRAPDGGSRLLEVQLARITDPERRERFAYLIPALDPNAGTRATFLEAYLKAMPRPKESWILDGLRLTHHPLRTVETEELLAPSLEPLAELHRTGSIFFAKRWLDAVLEGYSSPAAAAAVQAFLDQSEKLSPRLRQKVLQSADDLFRAAGTRPGR